MADKVFVTAVIVTHDGATWLPTKHFCQGQKLFPSISMAGVEARLSTILFSVNHFYDECHVGDLFKPLPIVIVHAKFAGF